MSIIFIDSEISKEGKILDIGAVKENGEEFHENNLKEFENFISDSDFVCGHNIVNFDSKYLKQALSENTILIDTLYLSPILFPKKPYHKLLKDDKLQPADLNNPLNDAIKSKNLFFDELNAFQILSSKMKWILCALLYNKPEFQGFFRYINYKPYQLTEFAIKEEFKYRICENTDIASLISQYPVELAYSLSIISTDDKSSITPPWIVKNYPMVENIIKYLRQTPCRQACRYCNDNLNAKVQLKKYFGYSEFRTYNNEPLQENAVNSAIKGDSLLAIFPTGGGKSITFQLPALIAAETSHSLTVVISPLQSLMKDQVDNLEQKEIYDAVTINGMLNPIERQQAIERVFNGSASILYISPEQLRSKTIERMLLSRNISRFVIDEAHCFSAWGQDFRVDYLYIGDFIRELQKKKHQNNIIPVSCFTATAKQKVVTDICDYFKRKLNIELKLFTTTAVRENLHYSVIYKETEDEKYNTLRNLIETKKCPTIVYVSRTRRTIELANKLTADGYLAKAFNGKMDSKEKITNQEAFMNNEVQIIVATSAFGMGVDKKDIKLVIHYDISDSLENYIQEAGRAGRDQTLQAECFILFNDNDLDKHFILLNQSKLSISEIQQVWKAIKDLTKFRSTITCSPLEIARQAGWDDSVTDIETRVKTAISALENAGYVKRGNNVPKLFASSITAKNMSEASLKIDKSDLINDKNTAKRIIKYLISSRSICEAQGDDAESRVDYIADRLGLEKEIVINIVNQMRQIGLLADMKDMSVYIHKSESQNKSYLIFDRFLKLENYIVSQLNEETTSFNLKNLNELALNNDIKFSSVKNIKTIIYFWIIKNYIQKPEFNSQNRTDIALNITLDKMKSKVIKRIQICKFIIDYLYKKSQNIETDDEQVLVEFSLVEMQKNYNELQQYNLFNETASLDEVSDAMLYLSKIGALNLQGGFLVIYNGIQLKRLILDNKIRYKAEDYHLLSEFYKQKIQQIHIVGEYANLMVKNYDSALKFVADYFQMDFKKFISKYFKGERATQIERNITPEKYNKLFNSLSDKQSEIIDDFESKFIVVTAGPGSGKTKVLVHKLASLLLLEDVKHEQLLMITFSRAAATEFKKRLIELIGNAAHFIEIKTFHSYCFDLLGKIGNLEDSENVVKDAAELINSGNVEKGKITKAVVVIDEAQDMDDNEFALIKSLIKQNEDMRLIAVGDDDQNIYEFRGSDSKHLNELVEYYGAKKYEMTENYRSSKTIVEFANSYVQSISSRLKTNPIISMSNSEGNLQLVKHNTRNMEQCIVNDILSNKSQDSTCVLTNTNDDALKLLGLLTKNNIRAKLIQSINGFQLYNLVEMRYFIDKIDSKLNSPVISNDIWNFAKKELQNKYSKSKCLDNCLELIKTFENINRTKYRTDFEEFVKESKFEDFYPKEKNCIFVSTIHKAKGKEFDTVYLMLNNFLTLTDESKRQLYVAITRAKQNLIIHYNNDLFNNIKLPKGTEIKYDNTKYDDPKEITLQLTHKDVYLDFFKYTTKTVNYLCSGDFLEIENENLIKKFNNNTYTVAKLSKNQQEKIKSIIEKGYKPINAEINFIVKWKGKDNEEEINIILPQIHFVSTKQ